MSPRDLILEYLEFTETKSCTMVGIWVLCEEFRISRDVITFTLTELVHTGDIIMEEKDPLFLTVVKLVPKFKIIH